MKSNFVAKNLHKTCKPLVVPQKQRKLKSEATLREMPESLSNNAVEPETMCFDEALQGCMNCVGCSSISIEGEED